MAKCKFCGKPVTCATVHHADGWKQETEKVALVFCDEYCRFPREGLTEDELQRHCNDCALVKLLNLGL